MNKCPNQLTKPRQIVFPPFLFSVSGSYGGKHRGDPIDLSCFIVLFFFSFLSFLLFFFSSFFFFGVALVSGFLLDLRGLLR